MKQFNLGWGDPIITRQALVETLGRKFVLTTTPLQDIGYPNHIGSPKLIEQLKKMAKRHSGHSPKHLFVTCGATGGLHAALYASDRQYTEFVVTENRYYPMYPAIIKQANLTMIDRTKRYKLLQNGHQEKNFISLTASPSAPEGLVYFYENVDIWDAAYASKTYSFGGHIPNKYKIMVGSLSKTLGLSGLRLGWVGTDDDSLSDLLKFYVTTNYVGLSSVSMAMAEEVLDSLNQDKFEERASGYLNDNREEMQKVLTKFGQGDVPSRGMFAILQLGKIERRALERANVIWQSGDTWGENDNWARLSLGQSREVVRSAVKCILK